MIRSKDFFVKLRRSFICIRWYPKIGLKIAGYIRKWVGGKTKKVILTGTDFFRKYFFTLRYLRIKVSEKQYVYSKRAKRKRLILTSYLENYIATIFIFFVNWLISFRLTLQVLHTFNEKQFSAHEFLKAKLD